MSTDVTTPDQLTERIGRLIATVPGARVSSRLTTDGTKLYASITCQSTMNAEQVLDTIRRNARAEFGELGSDMTARRDFRHVHVFLPVPKANAERGAQFLESIRPRGEDLF